MKRNGFVLTELAVVIALMLMVVLIMTPQIQKSKRHNAVKELVSKHGLPDMYSNGMQCVIDCDHDQNIDIAGVVYQGLNIQGTRYWGECTALAAMPHTTQELCPWFDVDDIHRASPKRHKQLHEKTWTEDKDAVLAVVTSTDRYQCWLDDLKKGSYGQCQ